MEQKLEEREMMLEKIAAAQKVLIGIGNEWKIRGSLLISENEQIRNAYGSLYRLVKDKDYFIVTTLTDGAVYETAFDQERIVAPCGNVHWLQCANGCSKDVWKENEVKDICPHCKGPLTENTVEAEHYVEEGYLPMWKKYQLWLSCTLNRDLTVLELGEGFKTPTVIRWPFEKTVFFNQKSWMFRVNREFYQVTAEISGRSTPVAEDSPKWITKAALWHGQLL